MQKVLTIWCAAAWLALFTCPSWAQVPFDLSQAVEVKTVWKMDLGGEANPMAFNRNFGGKEGLDILTTGIGGPRKHQTWATRPQLDTTNLFDWMGINNATRLCALDYDGVPPMEYVNSKGIIWRCAEGPSPFPLTPMDTAAYATCTGDPLESVDVDGDGFLDVITTGGGPVTARVIMGGPQAGKGCERVFTIPKVEIADGSSQVWAFFRSSNGGWVLVQQENRNLFPFVHLSIYDVTITREAGVLKVLFTKKGTFDGGATSPEDEPLGTVAALVDTVTKHDWLLVQHRIGSETFVVERFDITDRQFNSTGEKVTGLNFQSNQHFGHTLDLPKPVIAISSSGTGLLFCYADNIRQPFARWDPQGSGVQPVSGYAVINDQTGDGKPDIVVAGGSIDGRILLLTLDPNPTSVGNQPPAAAGPEARMVGDILELTLVSPSTVSADIVATDGRASRILAPMQGTPGLNRYDLSQPLRSLPASAYHVRVRVGASFLTIPIIR